MSCGILINDILLSILRKPADVLYLFSVTAYEDCRALTSDDADKGEISRCGNAGVLKLNWFEV